MIEYDELHTSHQADGSIRREPSCWCDLCGWGYEIVANADGEIHICHRHSADEVRDFWTGRIQGYNEGQQELFD